MMVSLTDAKSRLTDLVRRAEAGDEIILTRHGHAAVRLVPVKPAATQAEKDALLDAVFASARAARLTRGTDHDEPDAARSQDYLYDEFGLPK